MLYKIRRYTIFFSRSCRSFKSVSCMNFKVVFGQQVVFLHLCQHHIPTLFTALGRGTRIIAIRRFKRTDKRSRFIKRKVSRRFVKESLRRTFYPVSIIAERHSIEVKRQDFLLAVYLFYASGYNHLFDFVYRHRKFPVALSTSINIFSQLHCNSAPPS